MWDYEDLEQEWLALQAWIQCWDDEADCEKLVNWAEANIEDTFSVFRLQRTYSRRIKSTTMLERTNVEIRRRKRVIRIFPNEASWLRLIRTSGSKPKTIGYQGSVI